MATVTNNLTRIHDCEGSLTAANLPSGGAGAAANTDIFLQAAQSLGKRITDTAGPSGFLLVDAADNDCSAADVHVGVWFWVTHYAILDAVRIAFGTGTGTPTNYDAHTFDYAAEYSRLGGWVRAWVDVSRTSENPGGTGLDEAALRSYGVQVSFSSSPGGSAANVILDAADFTNGGAALTLTGTSGLWSNFTTADENSSNQYGVFRTLGGVYNCFARVQLGSASSLVFSDSSFTVVFPHQNLVNITFMGVTYDLQHASTSITLSNGAFVSSGTIQGDFIVSGTTGTLTATNVTFASLRIVTLTSACSIDGGLFSKCGLITLGGATIDGATISNATGSIGITASSPAAATGITNTTFISDGTGHGLEITGTAANITLTGLTWSNYAATSGSSGNEAIFINIGGGTMDVSISGGTTPSIKTAGCTVNVISNAVNATVIVKTSAGAVINGARVLLKASDGTGPMPFNITVTISNSGTTATVTHGTHGMATNDKVLINGASHWQNNGVFSITKIDAGSYSYTLPSDPGSSPSGTIKATFVALEGLTSSGQITMSRVFNTDQPVDGWVRKSSSSPYYKTSMLSGIIYSATGYSGTVILVGDE